jgi:APA family basic amino acid/polyamine antiporter
MHGPRPAAAHDSLRAEPARRLGRWSLVALGMNMVIGSGFFLFPSRLYDAVGAWSPLLVAGVGLLMLPIAFSFAEAASRFDTSGGPYQYVRAAFGQLIAFEVGWLLWISRVVSQAAVLSGMLLMLNYLLPHQLPSLHAQLLCVTVTGSVAAFSIAGGTPNMAFINTLTVLKVIPVLGLLGWGLVFGDFSRLSAAAPPEFPHLASAAVLVLYSFAGFELLAVPAGEAKDPARDAPVALLIVLISAAVIMALANVVVITTLEDPTRHEVPLAASAAALWGPWGAMALLLTALVSIVGHNATSLLFSSRLLHAAASNGELPKVFGLSSKRFQTPWVAVITSAVAVVALTITGTFESLVILASGTRLLVYAAVILAAWRLRRMGMSGPLGSAAYTPPIPGCMTLLGLALCVLLLLNIQIGQILALVGAAALGMGVFALRKVGR